MKRYLVFVTYNYTNYAKYYKSFNRAEITQRKLQKYYPNYNVYIEVIEED